MKAIPADDLEPKTQQAISVAWSSLLPDFDPSHIHVIPSIGHAIREIERISIVSPKPVQVLVAGSLHLVGGVIVLACRSSHYNLHPYLMLLDMISAIP